MEINIADIVLCEFYFSDYKKSKNRPVLVFKDNLPHDDFIAIPISSKIDKIHNDELLLGNSDVIKGSIPKDSKIMIRKTFVVSKNSVIKKYGTATPESYQKFHQHFCNYFQCQSVVVPCKGT